MQDILFNYQRINPTTWVYLSSLLTIALYFKFGRLWSVRNFDLIGLILFAPGLLLEVYGREKNMDFIEHAGYVWLFCVGGVFLVRLLLDAVMVRRPLLDPNLSVGGMTFIGVSLLIFLMANIANSNPEDLDLPGSQVAQDNAGVGASRTAPTNLKKHGPRFPWFEVLPNIVTQRFFISNQSENEPTPRTTADMYSITTARALAILSHLAIVIGMIWIGLRHFDNIRSGIAAAVLYLLLPYTAEMTGHLQHVLPAAVLVWAFVFYRLPLVAGLLIGLAIGLIYYPMYLLPLWISFYFARGAVRFLIGVLAALGVLILLLATIGFGPEPFLDQLRQMLGLQMFSFENLRGFWEHPSIHPEYRLPVFALFVALCGSFALWPAQKHLGTLLSCSAVVMLGTQFWQSYEGGLYMAWYLPLTLLTIFRPNLEDRLAKENVRAGWI